MLTTPRPHVRWIALGLVATALGVARPADARTPAPTTVGVEWELKTGWLIGVPNPSATVAGTYDSKQLICTVDTRPGLGASAPIPLLALTYDLPSKQLPNLATLEIVSAPMQIGYDVVGDMRAWTQVETHLTSFASAVTTLAKRCTGGECLLPVKDVLGELDRLEPKQWKLCPYRGAGPLAAGIDQLGFRIMTTAPAEVFFAKALNTQVNVRVDLGAITDPRFAHLFPKGDRETITRLREQVEKLVPMTGFTAPIERENAIGFLIWYYFSLHAYESFERFKSPDEPRWNLKNQFGLFPKATLAQLRAALGSEAGAAVDKILRKDRSSVWVYAIAPDRASKLDTDALLGNDPLGLAGLTNLIAPFADQGVVYFVLESRDSEEWLPSLFTLATKGPAIVLPYKDALNQPLSDAGLTETD